MNLREKVHGILGRTAEIPKSDEPVEELIYRAEVAFENDEYDSCLQILEALGVMHDGETPLGILQENS